MIGQMVNQMQLTVFQQMFNQVGLLPHAATAGSHLANFKPRNASVSAFNCGDPLGGGGMPHVADGAPSASAGGATAGAPSARAPSAGQLAIEDKPAPDGATDAKRSDLAAELEQKMLDVSQGKNNPLELAGEVPRVPMKKAKAKAKSKTKSTAKCKAEATPKGNEKKATPTPAAGDAHGHPSTGIADIQLFVCFHNVINARP